MPNKILNAKLLWMQFEDILAPRLGLTVWDRAVYSYLLRHSLVVGKLRLHFAVLSVARDLGLSNGPVRQAVRRLDELGALRLLERSKTGHLVEMRLPGQIRAVRPAKGDIFARHSPARRGGSLATRHFLNGASQAAEEPPASALEATRFGRNSYRNLVSCCIECNTRKGDRPVPDFLRTLYRQGRLTPAELDGRLRALKDLAAGKLRPLPAP